MNRRENFNESNIFSTECPLCLKKFDSDRVFINCHHYFHKECIMNWKIRNNICPICRVRITEIKDVFNIKNLVKEILTLIIRLTILILVTRFIVTALNIYLIPLTSKIVEVPKNFIIKFLNILLDILILIVVIIYKLCNKIVFGIFSLVYNIFGVFESILDSIIQFMNSIKAYLENICRKL